MIGGVIEGMVQQLRQGVFRVADLVARAQALISRRLQPR
jgi:hypothetical protein